MYSFLFVFILLWDLFDSLAPKGLFYPALLQVVFIAVLVAFFVYEFVLIGRGWSSVSVVLLACFGGVAVFSFIGILLHDYRSVYNSIGDFSNLAVLVLLVGVSAKVISKISEKYFVNILLTVLSISAIAAVVSAKMDMFSVYAWNGRYDPAHPLLFVMLMYLYIKSAGGKKLFIGALVAGIFFQILFSGSRTWLLLFVISALLIIYLSRPKKLFMSAIFLIMLFSLVIYMGEGITPDLLDRSRLGTLANASGDESLQGRLEEVYDVFLNIKTNNPVTWITGVGPGGTWMPDRAYPEMNILDDGRVYYIHITPVSLYYRFGLLGLLLYLMLGYFIVYDFVFRRHLLYKSLKFEILLVCVALIYINSFMRTFLNDMTYLLIILSYLYYRSRPDTLLSGDRYTRAKT